MELSYYYQPEAVKAAVEADCNGVILLPTGSGKSHVLRGIVEAFPEGILILSHVKEILEQNFSRLAGLDDIAIYSAALDIKMVDRVTVASIQSVYNKPHLFGHVKLVLIDEAHLVSDEGMYKTLLDSLGVPYIGLTATDFRLKGGYIHGPDGMFDKIIYQADAEKLTKEGYLCPLKYKGDKEPMDVTGVRTTGGDYNLKDMSLRFNRDAVTDHLADKISQYSEYKHILIFCIDIEHAERMASSLEQRGMSSKAVHSKSPRDESLRDFKAGRIQALTNVNILTTGFDFPAIDMIVVLRPTKSLTLHQQMLGRGMRTHPSKTYTLVKDFTSNTANLGTVTDPADMEYKKRGKGKGETWMKNCPECELMWPTATLRCTCGYKFQFRHHIKLEAHKEVKLPQWYQVDQTYYSIHHKVGKPNSLKITYICGVKKFTQYILLDHGGQAAHNARAWLRKRYKKNPLPTNIGELYKNTHNLKPPIRVQVDESSKYARILSTV